MFFGMRTLSRATPSLLLLSVLLSPAARIFAQAATAPSFEVATIKPSDPNSPGGGIGFSDSKFTTKGQTVKGMMKLAYNLNIGTDSQISGGPSWLGTTKWDIVAKMDDETVAALPKLSNVQRRERVELMVQTLLADRFKLKVHHETKELPVYALTVGKNGSKLTPSVDAPHGPDAGPDGKPSKSTWHGIQMQGRGQMEGRGATPDMLANVLGFQPEIGGRMVIDKTELKGTYDFLLKWTPDASLGTSTSPFGNSGAPVDPTGPSLFTALREELGLTLDATKAPVDTIVIDSVELPSEN
jgi:uncharacterized protein (TIGR03435 family)